MKAMHKRRMPRERSSVDSCFKSNSLLALPKGMVPKDTDSRAGLCAVNIMK